MLSVGREKSVIFVYNQTETGMKTNGNMSVKVGQKVKYRGNFGSGPIQVVEIESIELCEDEHEKYGTPVDEVDVWDLKRCCVTLDNGHWAYGYQIVEIL